MALAREATSTAAWALHWSSEATHTFPDSPGTWAPTSKHRPSLGASGISLPHASSALSPLAFSMLQGGAMAGQKLGPYFLSPPVSFHVLYRMHRQNHMPFPGISSWIFKVNGAIPLRLLLACFAALLTGHSRLLQSLTQWICLVQIQFRSFSLVQRHEMMDWRFHNC